MVRDPEKKFMLIAIDAFDALDAIDVIDAIVAIDAIIAIDAIVSYHADYLMGGSA